MVFFGEVQDLEQYDPKLGERVVVAWRKSDGSACGGTEGVLLGVSGDKVSGEYLVIDRSTYQGSFKSALSLLNILDLRVLSMNDVEVIRKADLRRRPPGISENFKMKMEIDYRSNIDFEATQIKIIKRRDCKVTPNQAPHSGAIYGIGITKIKTIEDASITISAGGALQIFCPYRGLNDCIRWVEETVELLQGHKRLVLFATKVMYSIYDTYGEQSRPTEDVISRIAIAEDGPPVVLPIGWASWFFGELDANPLQSLFPRDQPLENFVLENAKGKDRAILSSDAPVEKDSKLSVDLRLPDSKARVSKYLGADAPVFRVAGSIKSTEDEKSLMTVWMESCSNPWHWLDEGDVHGKVIIHDLTIDRKNGVYTVEFRKYSGNEF